MPTCDQPICIVHHHVAAEGDLGPAPPMHTHQWVVVQWEDDFGQTVPLHECTICRTHVRLLGRFIENVEEPVPTTVPVIWPNGEVPRPRPDPSLYLRGDVHAAYAVVVSGQNEPDPPPRSAWLADVETVSRELNRIRGERWSPETQDELWDLIDNLVFLAREKQGGPDVFCDEEVDRQEREAIEHGEPPSVYHLIRNPRI